MSLRLIHGLIFDYGRVLGRFDKNIPATEFSKHSPYDAPDIIKLVVGSDIETAFETGSISEAEFARRIVDRIGLKDVSTEWIVRTWGDMSSPNTAIEPFIQRFIEQGVPIAVLSNTNSSHWPFNMQLPVMKKLVAYGAPFILSHEVGVMKPDSKMFNAALAALSTVPEKVLFIDDIPEYIAAARALGLHAEQYNCETDQPQRLVDIFTKYDLLD